MKTQTRGFLVFTKAENQTPIDRIERWLRDALESALEFDKRITGVSVILVDHLEDLLVDPDADDEEVDHARVSC